MVRTRKDGVAIPRRMLKEAFPVHGLLVILDVTDQGLRRQVKVARLYQETLPRFELVEPHIVWANEGRFTLAGFERSKNEAGDVVDYAQSWLCTLELDSRELFESVTSTHSPRVER